MTDKEAQDDELLALSNIYDERTFSSFVDEGKPGGCFYASVELPPEFVIKLGREGHNLHEVIALPSVQLNFQFPSDYPSESPPSFTLTCQWLSRDQLTLLCQKLDQLWEENDHCEVLFTWCNFLESELMDYLKLSSPLDLNAVFNRKRRKINSESAIDEETSNSEGNIDHTADDAIPGACARSVSQESDVIPSSHHDPRAIQDLGAPGSVLASILELDQLRRQELFNGSLFHCDICFTEKLGNICTQFFNCKHVYCKDCTRTYLEVQIQDGNVSDLKCPHDKCETLANPAQVKDLVSEELFAKYDRLLLQSSLDKMTDICYCPRKDCQSPVLKDSADEKLGQCPRCYFVFCTFCLAAYHGSKTPCTLKIDTLTKLREQYQTATPEEREYLMRKYGRKVVLQALEEIVSVEWMQDNAKRCPDCNIFIQKNQGCNKITCTNCRCYFCYICGAKLNPRNPYSHYNVMRGTCFGKLFEGLEDDEDEEEDDEYDFLEEWVL